MKSASKSELQPLLKNTEESESKNENKTFMYLCCLVSLLGALSVGTMLGLTSPLIPDIEDDKSADTPHLSPTEASWFGGILLIGGIIGGIAAGYIMQGIGRKNTSLISAAPYIVGLVFIAFASRVWMLYVGRITSGFGVGVSSLVVPVYIGEISPPGLRGMLGSGTQLCIVNGILLVYGLGVVLPWRWLCLSLTILPAMVLFFSTFIVETPRYLMMKNQNDRARQALQRLRGPDADIEKEYEELLLSLSIETESVTWKEILLQKECRTPTIISLAAMYFQQLSGINGVMFYAKSLFETAGFSDHNQLTIALLSIAGVQVLFTLLSSLIIDRSGRRILIVIGGVFMTLSLATFGLYFQLAGTQAEPVVITTMSPATTERTVYTSQSLAVTEATSFSTMSSVATMANTTEFSTTHTYALATTVSHKANNLTWMALVSMLVFIAAYSIGLGPIAWLLVGEIIPVKARGISAGLSTAFNLFLAFIVTSTFSSMLSNLTPQGTFWFFAGNCALSIFFAIFVLPETKGRKLEEIEAYFRGEKSL